jgi:hypothetical protein
VTATIRLRRRELDLYMDLKGIPSKAALATRIGVDESTVHRVLGGRAAPGTAFIGGLLMAFGPKVRFEDLFECLDDKAVA